MEYDAAKDAHDSYFLAIEEKRRREEFRARIGAAAKRVEFIGNCVLIQGDCMDVMPTLGKVDAVVTDPPYGIKADEAAAKKMESLDGKITDIPHGIALDRKKRYLTKY